MIKPRLTAAERTVMKIFWDADEDLVLKDVLAAANDVYDRGWKPQTVTAYLSHLVIKGFIEMYKEGRNFYYTVIIDEATYRKEYVEKEVDFWNKSNRLQYVCDMFDAMDITEDEYKEIQKKLKAMKKK